MAVSSLIAIEFSHLGIRHARVFYQYNEEKVLRESCYRKDYGWFIRGDGVITTDAQEGSSIAAACWEDASGAAQIGVFYIDANNNICRAQGDHELTTKWKSTPADNIGGLPIGQSSQLSVVQSGDGKFLHLFYQGPPISHMKAPLRELRYDTTADRWQSRPDKIVQDSMMGSRMSAVWDSAKQLVRLYYQDHHMMLREVCWVAATDKWMHSANTVKTQLLADAPITAVAWAKLTKGTTNFTSEIRVYTVLSANEGRVAQIAYSNRTWKITPMPEIPFGEDSDIAACRSTGVGTLQRSPICVFYHWRRRGIDMAQVPVEDSPKPRLMPSDIHRPHGIPISMGGEPAETSRPKEGDGKDDGNGTPGGDRKEGQADSKAQDNDKSKREGTGNGDKAGGTDLKSLLQYLDLNVQNADGNSPLHLAAMAGNKPAVRLLIENGADLKTVNAKNYTPLHLAVQEGKEAVIRLLLDKGADIEASCNDGTPLGVAILNRKEQMVNFLLELKAAPDGADKDGNMPIHVAAKNGDEAMFNLVLAKGAYVNSQNNAGDTSLYLAASFGHEKIVSLLIAKKADMKRDNNDGNLPLHGAVKSGIKSVVQLLLDKEAKVDSKNNEGNTPLYLATAACCEDTMRPLLEKGADVNGKNHEGNTALHLAARKGYEGLMNLLCEKRADINIKNDRDDLPIHSAVERDYVTTGIDTLLAKGANINSNGFLGRSPLHGTVANDHAYLMRYLLEKGANINSQDNLRYTPLHLAAQAGRTSLAETLLNKGALVNMKAYKEATPLLLAVGNNHEPMTRLLLQKGAQINYALEETSYGRKYEYGTALHIAVGNKNKALVELLLDKGAFVSSSAYLEKHTPLHRAMWSPEEDIIRQLVAKGAHINFRAEDGKTPLALAYAHSWVSQEIRQFLVSKGATT